MTLIGEENRLSSSVEKKKEAGSVAEQGSEVSRKVKDRRDEPASSQVCHWPESMSLLLYRLHYLLFSPTKASLGKHLKDKC